MGYGNGVVDWGMQSAPLHLPPKVDMSKWQAAIDEEREKSAGWRKLAIEVQADYDKVYVQKKTWEALSYEIRDSYAPHLSEDDLFESYDRIQPAIKKKYWQESSSKRTWDK